MFAELYIYAIKYIVILISIVGLIYVVKQPKIAFYIILFTFPFKNFYVWVGTDLQVWKLLSIAFLVIHAPNWIINNYHSGKVHKHILFLFAFFSFVILSTILNELLITDVKQMIGGYFKNEGRIYYQIIFFVLTLNLIIIPMKTLTSIEDVILALRVLFFAFFILAIFGGIQFLVVHFTGVNPFPIYGANETHHSGYLGDTVFRINSLAGEPKHMAIAMVLGITIVLLARINNLKIIKNDLVILALFAFNLLFTYSTTGYALLALSLIIMVLIKGVFSWKSISLILGITIVSFFVYTSITNEQLTNLNNQVARAGIEIQDKTIKSYFYDHPLHATIGTGLGNIHHFAVSYLPASFPLFRDTPYKANSGILFMLADYGLVGIILLYFSFSSLVARNLNLLKDSRFLNLNEISVLTHFSIVFSVLFLARYNELYFVLFGMLLSINVILNRAKRSA